MAFTVTIRSTNSPVKEGESYGVEVRVENTGELADTQQVSLTVGGEQRDSTEISLENGQSTTGLLGWQTGEGDAGTYEAVVASADSQDTATVTVEEGTVSFDVSIDWTNAPLTAGEPLCVACTVQNTGTVPGEGTVGVGFDSLVEPVDEKTLALDPGTVEDINFQIPASEYQEGNEAKHEKKLWGQTGTDRDEMSISVNKPAHFAVDIQSTNAPVNEGETLEVTATVENTGGETGQQTVALAADVKELADQLVNAAGGSHGGAVMSGEYARAEGDDGLLDSTGLELAPGESAQVTLEWDTAVGDAGDHALAVVATPAAPDDGGPYWPGSDEEAACVEGTQSDAAVVAVDRHGPIKTGRFEVQIDGVEVPGWQSVTIPGISVEQGSYREGSDPEYEKKVWGQTTFDDLEMERGVKPGALELHNWIKDIQAGKADSGRKEIAVKIQDEEGQPMIRWEFQSAWIKDYSPPEFDASADGDMATESVTIAFDEMIRTEG